MNKLILFTALTAVLLLSASCAKRFSLAGHYQETPYAIPTTESTNDTWLHTIDFITQRGITPKIIKKNKSLMITDTISFKNYYTTEVSGKLLDSTQYVVLPYMNDKALKLSNITAYWTIRIHSRRNKSAVLIELSKITATYNHRDKEKPLILIGNHVSTGRFEGELAAYLKEKKSLSLVTSESALKKH